MTEVSINQEDIKRLGVRLMDLQHKLSTNERAILWGALGLAADALGNDPLAAGVTSRVGPGEASTVTVDNDWAQNPALMQDFPEMLALAFTPGIQPPAPSAKGSKPNEDPIKSQKTVDGGKIGGKIGGDGVMWKISSAPPGQ